MLKDVVVELDGKILSPDEYKNYICTSKIIDELVGEAYKRVTLNNEGKK